jgi:hypothetical protein
MNTTKVFCKKRFKHQFLGGVSKFEIAKDVVFDMRQIGLELDIILMNAYLAKVVSTDQAEEVLSNIKEMGLKPNMQTKTLLIQKNMHESFKEIL